MKTACEFKTRKLIIFNKIIVLDVGILLTISDTKTDDNNEIV